MVYTTTRVNRFKVILKTCFHCRQNRINVMENSIIEFAYDQAMFRFVQNVIDA